MRFKYLKTMVGERGFEPPTPWSRTRCSTRLSHSPTESIPFILLHRCPVLGKSGSTIWGLDAPTALGVAEFKPAGRGLRLEPVPEDPDDQELFFIFGDATGKKTTYRLISIYGTSVHGFASRANPDSISTAFTTILRIQCFRGLSTAGAHKTENPFPLLVGEKSCQDPR